MSKSEPVGRASYPASVFQPAMARSRTAGIEVGAILTSILIIATCGLVYELIIGSLSSYLMGDSVFQFSLTLGFYLSAMGIGSFLSRAVKEDLLRVFLIVEILIGLLGGASAAVLFAAYAYLPRGYPTLMIAVLVVLGTLIGLEIPLLTRIARRYGSLRNTISNVLAVDYLGALAASLLFPLVLLPYLGITKTAFLVGMFNIAVVGINLRIFGDGLRHARSITFAGLAAFALLLLGFAQSTWVSAQIEDRIYQDPIIYAEQSHYQRIVLTTYQDELRLYLDRELQFSSRDEYRYHESLVLPAMSLAPSHESVLVIGGGDGLAMREVLKYSDVGHATLVDLDPSMTHLGQTFGRLTDLNRNSLNDPRVTVANDDGYQFLANSPDLYPVIIIDLPDPRNEALAKLYSKEFYTLVKRHLARGGIMVQQSSSPFFVRKAYWSIAHTVAAAGLNVQTYHTYIPSFGDWGYVMASDLKIDWSRARVDVPARYLTAGILSWMTMFEPDTSDIPADISTLQNPAVLHYYIEDWRRWRG